MTDLTKLREDAERINVELRMLGPDHGIYLGVLGQQAADLIAAFVGAQSGMEEALRAARSQLVTLGGDPRAQLLPGYGAATQAAVLDVVDAVLAGKTEPPFHDPRYFGDGPGKKARRPVLAPPLSASALDEARNLIRHTRGIALAYLRYRNPAALPEDESQQWQSLYHQCELLEVWLSANPKGPKE